MQTETNNYKTFVTTRGDTLNFEYWLWDANHQFQVRVTNGIPEGRSKNIKIFTYNYLPYLVKDCEALK